MVCMYDGNVYNFTQKGFETLNREELFLHFRDGHESDIFAMYDAEES